MRLTLPASLALATLAVACGGSPPPKAAAPRKDETPTASPTTTAAGTERVTELKRSHVRAMIRSGLGVFFQNVALDDWPVMKDGRFYGFKLRAMNPEWNVDLHPGDVILRVNGMKIEHPEEADLAMRSLEKAASLRVDIERDGMPAVFELPIVDDGQKPSS